MDGFEYDTVKWYMAGGDGVGQQQAGFKKNGSLPAALVALAHFADWGPVPAYPARCPPCPPYPGALHRWSEGGGAVE